MRILEVTNRTSISMDADTWTTKMHNWNSTDKKTMPTGPQITTFMSDMVFLVSYNLPCP